MARRKYRRKSKYNRRKHPLPTEWILGIIALAMIFTAFPTALTALFEDNAYTIVVAILFFAFLVAGGVAAALFYRSWKRNKYLKAVALEDVDGMRGIEFEHYCSKLLNARGNRTWFTKASGDMGIDLITEIDGIKYAIQVKRYSKPVGRAAISDAVAGVAAYGYDRAAVITNNYFTKGAKEYAKLTNCLLIDREILGKWIHEVNYS